MSKQTKQKARERAAKQRKREQIDQQLKAMREKSPQVKKALLAKGCVLPFYEFLDSYVDEFQRIAEEANAHHPSLLAIREVEDREFAECEKCWADMGYGDLEQIFFGMEDEVPDYGKRASHADMSGVTVAFLDKDQALKTLILIRRSVKGCEPHPEDKYRLKTAGLLHEIGHVRDIEQGVNFDIAQRRRKVIESEVFAFLYALEQAARRNLVQVFETFIHSFRRSVDAGGYGAEIARQVLERMPAYQLKNWRDVPIEPTT